MKISEAATRIVELEKRIETLDEKNSELTEALGKIVVLSPWQVKVLVWTSNAIAGILGLGGVAAVLNPVIDFIHKFTENVK